MILSNAIKNITSGNICLLSGTYSNITLSGITNINIIGQDMTNTIISGKTKIDSSNTLWSTNIDPNIRSNIKNKTSTIYQISLTSLGIIPGPIGQRGFKTTLDLPSIEVFQNNIKLNLPSYSPSGLIISNGIDYNNATMSQDLSPIINTINNNTYMVGVMSYDWKWCYLLIKSMVDNMVTLVKNASGQLASGLTRVPQITIDNVFTELNNGQYYVDRTTNILYVIPIDGKNIGDIFITTSTSNLLSVSNCSNITFSNLKFEGTRVDGINFINCQNCIIDNCILQNIISNGIVLDGTSVGNTISNCSIRDIGLSGISTNGNNTNIKGNIINDFSQYLRQYTTGINLNSTNNTIFNNKIYNFPHSAIVLYVGGNTIDSNDLSLGPNTFSDFGMIYFFMLNSIPKYITISNNFFHDMLYYNNNNIFCIYLDDMSSGCNITGNIFYNIGDKTKLTTKAASIYMHGGMDININKNYFINCNRTCRQVLSSHQTSPPLGVSSGDNTITNTFTNNILYNINYATCTGQNYTLKNTIWADLDGHLTIGSNSINDNSKLTLIKNILLTKNISL